MLRVAVGSKSINPMTNTEKNTLGMSLCMGKVEPLIPIQKDGETSW